MTITITNDPFETITVSPDRENRMQSMLQVQKVALKRTSLDCMQQKGNKWALVSLRSGLGGKSNLYFAFLTSHSIVALCSLILQPGADENCTVFH